MFAKELTKRLRSGVLEIRQVPKIILLMVSLILALGLGIRIYFLYQPIRYDEAYTFLHFVSSSFVDVIGDYSFPNNHIFHSLLLVPVTRLFGSWEWCLRLPALVAGLCLIPAMFILGLRARNILVGLWAAALIAASSYHVEYSVNARGYTLICLFTAILLTAVLAVRASPRSKSGWTVFILASVAGLFTIPIMLYPICMATIWLLLGAGLPSQNTRGSILRPLVGSAVIIALGTLICYTPVILITGAEALFASEFIAPLPLLEWVRRIPDLGKELLLVYHRDLPLGMAVLLVGGFLLGCYQAPRLLLASLLTVLALMLLQRVIPYPRVFTFGLVIYLLLAAIGFEAVIEWLFRKSGLKRRDVLLALLPTIWALAAVFFMIDKGGPASSLETGYFPESRKVVKLLAEICGKEDLFFARAPASEPLRYYGARQGLECFGFALSNGQPPPSMKLVVNTRVEKLEDLLNRYNYFSLFFKKPELLASIDSAEIYNLESIPDQRKIVTQELVLNYFNNIKAQKKLDMGEIMIGVCLGYNFLQIKEYDKAMRICERILRTQPDNGIALHMIGRIYHEKSQLDKARYYYKRVLERNPREVATLINMGMIARVEDKPEKAEQYYNSALSVDSTSIEAHFNLGNLFFINGKTDQAEKHYKFVMRKRPEDGTAHLYVGLLYLQNPRRHAEALKQFQIACQLLPEKSDYIKKKYILPLEANKGDKSIDN